MVCSSKILRGASVLMQMRPHLHGHLTPCRDAYGQQRRQGRPSRPASCCAVRELPAGGAHPASTFSICCVASARPLHANNQSASTHCAACIGARSGVKLEALGRCAVLLSRAACIMRSRVGPRCALALGLSAGPCEPICTTDETWKGTVVGLAWRMSVRGRQGRAVKRKKCE